MTLRAKLVGYLPIVLWILWPMIPVLIAGAVASSCGCQLDEGGPDPCILFGHDIGGLLSKMGMIGWFGVLTFPTGLLYIALRGRGLVGSFQAPDRDGGMPKDMDEFRCLGCGGVIHRNDQSCRKCGWIWK